MAAALSSVEDLEQVISSKIEEIGSTLGWAEYKATDAADTIETVQSQATLLAREVAKQTQRLRAIARKVGADDPVKKKAEDDVLLSIQAKLNESPELLAAAREGKGLSLTLDGDAAAELNQDDLTRLFAEAVKVLSQGNKSGA